MSSFASLWRKCKHCFRAHMIVQQEENLDTWVLQSVWPRNRDEDSDLRCGLCVDDICICGRRPCPGLKRRPSVAGAALSSWAKPLEPTQPSHSLQWMSHIGSRKKRNIRMKADATHLHWKLQGCSVGCSVCINRATLQVSCCFEQKHKLFKHKRCNLTDVGSFELCFSKCPPTQHYYYDLIGSWSGAECGCKWFRLGVVLSGWWVTAHGEFAGQVWIYPPC